MSSTPRKFSIKNKLTKTLLAFFIAFSLFWPIKFIQAIPLAPVLTGAEGAIGAASGIPVMTTKSPWQSIIDFIREQIKEVAGLAWKRTQVYFGTRLAHDAAVYLASGGRGQSSFIWNWDEVKELADGAAGEFLDDLSQTYFGKSACVPGDLGVQVQIDLNARALIGEMMDYATARIPNVCEAICSRTAAGAETTTRKVAGVGGDAAALFGQGMDASAVNKDLANYDKTVDDLINSILDSEEEMSRAIGKYIFEQVGYTLEIHPDIFIKDPDTGEFIDRRNYFYEKLTADHGARFASLVQHILDAALGREGVENMEQLEYIFVKKGIDLFTPTLDKFAWPKNNLEDVLGVMYWLKGAEYVAGTEAPVYPKDDSIGLLLDFFNEAYFLFNEMKSAPAAAIDLELLLEMIGNDDAVISKIKEYLETPESNGTLENSVRSTDNNIYFLEDSIYSSLSDKIFSLSDEVIALKTEIMTTHGADLDELIKSYQNFSQCVQACERGQIAEPHGVCTLSEIKKQEGFGGVTGIEGGVTLTEDWGPFGSFTTGIQEGTAIGKGGRKEHAEEMKEGARLTVADLQDLSTIGDPANNPLGQALQIMEKSQRQSEEAKERELQESQRAFASDKDLVSGEIKMPGSQVEGRLTGALADIRAANNEYTDSILAQMWGVFFNTLIKEFQEKLYGQGLQPKVYGGPFDPTTRRAYGEGIEAAKEQFSKFANPNITAGGEMNAQILTRLTTGCKEQPDNQQRFDECIIDNHFKDAIEQRMTLDEAVNKRQLIRGAFGFHKNGNQPIVGQGISYNSMIVLRKYRIIPSSWEAAAIWVRDVANKQSGSKDVTIEHVMDRYKDKTSPYYGLVNPGWVLKLPLFQCARQGAGEQIVSQSPMPYDSYFSEEGDFTVNISRMNDYCGDAKSCIREKNDGTGCEANGYGYCSVERDFWRFPSAQCKDEALYKTCQAYIDPNNQSVAYLDQTLNLESFGHDIGKVSSADSSSLTDSSKTWKANQWLNANVYINTGNLKGAYSLITGNTKDTLTELSWLNIPAGAPLPQQPVQNDEYQIYFTETECHEQSDGCQGYVRDYSWSRLTGGVSSRIDGLSDNPFTLAPDRFVEGFDESFGQDGLGVDYIDTDSANPRNWLPDPALYNQNIILNPLGLIDSVPTLWQCFNYNPKVPEQYGESCFYERIAGRKEGCKLPSGAYCDPWKEISLTRCVDNDGHVCYYDPTGEMPCSACSGATPVETTPNAKTVLGASSVNLIEQVESKSQLYWCGLPGGAGCFVGQEPVAELKTLGTLQSGPRTDDPPRHTTQEAGIRCVVGAWTYDKWTYDNESGEYTFQAVPDLNKTTPLTCSLYRQTENPDAIGNKRVYLTGNVQTCSLAQAGCQEYFGVEFPSNEYVKDGQTNFLKAGDKKEFIKNVLEDALTHSQKEFDYEKGISVLGIEPLKSLIEDGADFGDNEPKIVRKPLNFERQYCTEKDIDCRKYYPATGAEPLAGVLDSRKDLCPATCVGYAHYKEPVSPIENRLKTYIAEDNEGNIEAKDITGTIDRYFIADREESCPDQYAGCEYFMYRYNDKNQDLYLTDLRLCVNTKYPAINRAVYTIIESAAKGATNPVNIELVKSNYAGLVYYQTNGEQVQIKDTEFDPCKDGEVCDQLYKTGYNAPCITMDPTDDKNKNQTNPDLWQCTDDNHFDTDDDDDIESALERCLTVKTVEGGTKQVVSNLAKAECREYIYFPEAAGAERYALPNDLPIRVSDSCTAFKRGGAKSAFIYNIDSESEVLENMRCEESSVSCREYLGAGSSITGKLSWVDFEDVEKWGQWQEGKIVEGSIKPDPTKNVNDIAGEALKFTAGKNYLYNILQEPLDPVNSEKLFRDSQTGKVKSFKLSLWAQAVTKDIVIQIKLMDKDYNPIGDFTVGGVGAEADYITSDGKWHYIVFDQVSELSDVPHYFYVKSDQDFLLDSIVLEDSASIFRKQRDLAFVLKRCSAGVKIGDQCIDNTDCDGEACEAVDHSIAAHIDQDCNTDFTTEPSPSYDKTNPFPYQLSCQAYATDNNQPIAFKANTVSLCKDEVVGCEALVNTFNTQNTAADTYWPRGKDTEGKDPSGYDDYFVPKDSIEYVVANPSAECDQIGCTLLGREVKDSAGKVISFEEKYLIDDPLQYQDPNQPIACLIKERSCELYKTKETGTPKRFKSPNPFSCEWTTPAGYSTGWYKSVDEGGKIESCDPWIEQLDPAIDLEIKRPKAYCVERYTNRPVLDPADSLTAWCDWNSAEQKFVLDTCKDFLENSINEGIDALNIQCAQAAAQCPVDQSQCTWFKDPLESGLDKNYFQIHPNQQDIKGCGQTVNDDLGCRLFDDTEEGGPLKYDAEKSRNKGSLDTNCNPEDCYGKDGKLLPDKLPSYCLTNYDKCDANALMRVKRDRACGEWLSCKSAMTTDDGKDTVCLDVKPCNVRSADGECVNFVGDAEQSFTNKDIAQSKELFSRAGRLSGYSNMGYEWYQCPNPVDDIVILLDKKGDLCTTGKECIKEDRLYKKGNNCTISIFNTCTNKICQAGKFKGYSCKLDKDCYSDDELEHKNSHESCVSAADVCASGGTAKPGFKSLDHINQIGQHAEVVNGDFENVVFDVKGSEPAARSRQTGVVTVNKQTYPVGWEYTYCDINKCYVTKRYESTNPSAQRNPNVWSGKYSFLISGNSGKFYAVEQVIENVIPDSVYAISGWLKVSDGQGEQYSGIEIDQLNANGDYVGDYDCNYNNRSPSNQHCLISSGTKNSGWEYFVKKITTQPETRQLRVRLANTGNSTAIFDDIQIRAHIEAKPGDYLAPSCRLYPGANSLNCDALDNNNNLIRGWRGYCVEPDPRWNSSNPRWTNQCVQWWPIDVISGETNVLGTIDDTGYLNAPTPLHYCLETMDKEPGMLLPRLICVAKNDISGLGGEAYKYEACKIVALVSDPKPKFYGLGEGDWRLGVDANNFGEKNKVRMVLGGGDPATEHVQDMINEKHLPYDIPFAASGLCVFTSGNYFVGDNEPPDCVQGCFLNEDLAGWGNSDKNRGISTFRKSPNSNNKTYGCAWSNKQGSNWEECAQDLEQYYHKIAYFVFAQIHGNIDLDSGTAGCWEDGSGDRIYALRGSYASDTPKSKSAYPEKYIYPEVSTAKEITGDTPWDNINLWYYQSGRVKEDPVGDAGELKELADILTNPTPTRKHCTNDPLKACLEDKECGGECQFDTEEDKAYYIYDNFESVTRGRLNSMTWMERDGPDDGRFSEFSEITPRLGRPEQCSIMAQTVDVSGHNKAWFQKVQTGAPLDPPLGYDRTSYMCIPFGSAPYVRTPNDIMIEPYNKEDGQIMSPVQAPLELYHPENPENKDKGLMCQENYRGQGFYACGGLCNVCAGGARDGSFCMSDEECPSGSCGIGVCATPDPIEPYTPCDSDAGCSKGHCVQVGQDKFCAIWEVAKMKNGKELICSNTEYCQETCDMTPCENYLECRAKHDLNIPVDTPFLQSEPGISAKPESGLRRLQNIFAKIYKVWEWIKVDDENLKKKAGIDTGYYREMQDEDLDSILGSSGAWSKEKDIANLAVSCKKAIDQGIDIENPHIDSSFCQEFPGCRWIGGTLTQGCVPNGVPFTDAPSGGDPNHFRDYNYCSDITEQAKCNGLQPCAWENLIIQDGKIVSQPWKLCIPYQNQYPDITSIKIDTKETDQVVLYEDDRNVNLEFKITANQDQKPIVMVLIDWDDNTKTALSGIAWDDNKIRNFTHTYAYYPDGASGAPLGCKEYIPGDPTSYECRFRPRIKVVDNWGWCNGQKLTYYKDNPIADNNQIILSDPDLKIEQGEGLSWGYYGADCFIQEYIGRCSTGPYIGNKCIDNSNCGSGYTCAIPGSATADSRYGMQSWDYFGGYIEAEPPSEEARGADDQAPTVKMSFYQNTMTKLPPYVIGEMFTVQVDCKDDNIINKCWLEEFSQKGPHILPASDEPSLDCLQELNQTLLTFCNGDGSSCYAVEDCHFTGSYDGSKHWKYKAVAQDDNLNTGTDLNYDIEDPDDEDDGFSVEGLGIALGAAPTIVLKADGQDVETIPSPVLKTNTFYNFDLSCNSGGTDDSLYYCHILQSGGSYAMLVNCTDLAPTSIKITHGEAQIEVANCNDSTCLGKMRCAFSNAGDWVFTLKTADTEGNQVTRPANVKVEVGM